jgi:hypothetical protein
LTRTVTILANQAAAPFSIGATNDNLADGTQPITISASAPGFQVGNVTPNVTDDEPLPELSISDATVVEGDSGEINAIFTVTLPAAHGQQVTVDYATSSGTALADVDYRLIRGTLTIPANQPSGTITVPVNGDALHEQHETFFVTLSNPSNARLGDDQGRGIITDNDPLPAVGINSVSNSEAGMSLVFTVTLSAPGGQDVTVNYTTANGTAMAGVDHATTSGTLTLRADPRTGATPTMSTITVPLLEDNLDEQEETFFVNLSNPTNATLGVAQGIGTILDNDPTPTLAIDANVDVRESDSASVNVDFTIRLSGASGQLVTVFYATADGTATAPTDYVAIAPIRLTFNPGETTKIITVQVNGDLLDELDEIFFVTLANASNATITTEQRTGTIRDNDAPPSAQLRGASQSGAENVGVLTLTVELSAASGLDVTVPFALSGTAMTPLDYRSTPGSPLLIPAGRTTAALTLLVADDALDEADETVVVALGVPTNATLGPTFRHTAAILDNDQEPSVSINSRRTREGHSGTQYLVFTVTLSAISGRDVTVYYATADGQGSKRAKANDDYTPIRNTPTTVPAGMTSFQISVRIRGDRVREPDETFALKLLRGVHVTIAVMEGIGTIENDD